MSIRGRIPRGAALGCLAVLALSLLAPLAGATVTPEPGTPAGANAVGGAITDQPGLFTSAAWVHYSSGAAPTTPEAAGTANVAITTSYGVPTGPDCGILTSGDVALADDSNCCTSSGYATPAGDTYNGANDVAVLAVTVNVPATDNCLLVDVQFLSDEFPEFVGSSYNDAFIAEYDANTWSVAASTITAPDNFAMDSSGAPLTINSVGAASMTAADATGSTYDGATPRLSIQTPASPGSHVVYFTVFDAYDWSYDSAAFVDNMRTMNWSGTGPCEEGIVVVEPTDTVAAFKFNVNPDCGLHPVFFTDASVAGSLAGGTGTIASWTWDFGDGTGSSDQNPSHVYAAGDGVYDVSLTVMDADGRTDTVTQTVTIVYTECPPPPTKSEGDPTVVGPPRDGVDPDIAQADADGDGIPDAGDLCPEQSDSAQLDTDGDGLGDACDPDMDQDGIINISDDCAAAVNANQADLDADGLGDLCDADADNDGILDTDDNCKLLANTDQADLDGNGVGDLCEANASLLSGASGSLPHGLEQNAGNVGSVSASSSGFNGAMVAGALGVALLLVCALVVLLVRRRQSK